MQGILSQEHIVPASAASVFGLAVSALIQTPFGLLAPILGLFLFANGRAGLALHAAVAAGLAGALIAVAFYEGEARDIAVDWAAFFALAVCIGALVAIRLPKSRVGEARPAAGQSTKLSYPLIGPSLEEKAALRNSPAVSIDASDDKTTAAQLVAVSFWGGLPFHLRYWRREPHGRYRWVESRSEPLPEPSGTTHWRAATTEIDDQSSEAAPPTKTAANPRSDDAAVRAAKIVESLLGNAWAFDAAGRPTYLSPLAQTLVAATLEEFQAVVDDGHTFFKRTAHPDDYDRISAAWRHSLQTGEPFFLDRRIQRASGIHEWNRTGFVPTRDKDGRVTGWYGSTIDLDSHRITQAELRERERELLQLVDMVPGHIWRLTPQGEPIFFNKRLMDFFGLGDVAELDKPGMSRLAATIKTLIHAEDADRLLSTARSSFASGQPFSIKYRMRRADGKYRWVDTRSEPLRNQRGVIVQWYVISLDIDDEMRAQAELRQTQERLANASQAASLAELSASIAHEVNQPLAAVVANSHACQRWLTADPPNLERAQKTVERIIRDANGAADVVARIRALFKQNVIARSGSSVSAMIADAEGSISDMAMRHGVILDVRIEPDVPPVAVDQVQIQQVLINLMRNAVEAMTMSSAGKTLSVRASRHGDAVRIEVRDTGPGVEDAEKIFDAFFTTKDSGMGMGLAVSRSIVESHGGRLWAEQNKAGGASFIFVLPIEALAAS